jgi:predicted nucleic acid-binding protein
MKGVFDSNIVVDYLNEDSRASDILAKYPDKVISRITWMEILAGAADAADETRLRTVLSRFRVVELTSNVAETAVMLRRGHTPRLKLPDAIIYATAKEESCNLLTRNTRDFSSSASDVTVPYTI